MTDRNHLTIATAPIDVAAAFAWAADPAHGAANSFIGTVRDLNMGRDVVGVSYDVFDTLALNVFAELAAEARQRWGESLKIYISHFKGRLPVGGISVVIVVGSRHRDESFRACRFLIEEIKHRAPIWKQEHYTDGDSDWVQGHALCQHDKSQEPDDHAACSDNPANDTSCCGHHHA